MKLKAELQIANINVRREKEGENEGPVALDLKLAGSIALADIAELFSTPTGHKAVADLYTEDGDLRTHDIKTIELAAEGVGVMVGINTGIKSMLDFDCADVNKIKLTLKPGRLIDMAMRLQLKPTKGQIAALTDLLHESTTIHIESKQGELGLETPDAAAA